MANRKNGTIYIGVTSDLIARVYAHRQGLIPGFTKRYGCKLLVWYEAYDDLQAGAPARAADEGMAAEVEDSAHRGKNLDWDDL
jgi:putative endonuclease